MDPQRPLSVELFKQRIKLALGATALVVLVLINSNIHQMVLCLMRAPLDKVMVSPPPLMPNCTRHTFRHGLDLRVDVCRGEETGMVAFYLENAILRSYSLEDSTRLVDWLRRCTGHDFLLVCPLYSSSMPDCTYYSPLNPNDFICYRNTTMYLVINRFRFSKKESMNVLAFILQK